MRRIASYLYIGAAWLMVASLLATILMAGMALFVRNSLWSVHIEFGWGSELPGLLLIVLALIRWIPRRLTGWLVAVLLLHLVQTVLPGLREQFPYVAALHPLNASLLTYVSYLHAKRARQLLLDEPADRAQGAELGSQVEA